MLSNKELNTVSGNGFLGAGFGALVGGAVGAGVGALYSLGNNKPAGAQIAAMSGAFATSGAFIGGVSTGPV